MSVLRICLWSGPRNVSTAVMYSFAQRDDTVVVDEPLYAHYLSVSGVDHPGRSEVLEALESDGESVVRDIVLGPCERPVLFIKQMAHHLAELDQIFLDKTVNVFLIRDPREVLASIVHQLPNPTLGDTGLAVQSRLVDQLEARAQNPVVLDSRELLLAPARVLTQLCERVGIEFDSTMLSWPAGARAEDGVWAPHWYANVHRSNGFQPYRPKTRPLLDRLEPVAEQCRPHYEFLYARALRAAD